MEFTKIERRREELNAYANAIEQVNIALRFELNFISGEYSWADEEDIERAKIRAEILHTIVLNLEAEALK